MALTKEQKEQIIKDFGGDLKNTGTTEVQIALLTARINDLKNHFNVNTKDHSSRRGLLKIVGQRRRLLKYYKGINLDGYRALIAKLELRK